MRIPISVFVLSTFIPAYGQLEVTTSATNDGRTAISYKNNSTARLTALVAAWILTQPGSPHGSPSLTSKDAFIEDNFQAIPSGAQQSLYVGGKGLAVSQAQILAAVFEDGSSFGDPAWVRLIQMRRGYYLEALDAGLSDLKAAAQSNMSGESLVRQLTSSQASQLAATKTAPTQATAIRQLLNEPTEALKEANIQIVANGNWRGCIRAVYIPLIKTIGKAGAGQDGSVSTTAAVITNLMDKLTAKKGNLLTAKPAPLI